MRSNALVTHRLRVCEEVYYCLLFYRAYTVFVSDSIVGARIDSQNAQLRKQARRCLHSRERREFFCCS